MATNPFSAAESAYAFDLIWSQLQQRQNRHSSSWWFFLLFPDGEDGYGPQQLMFTVAARAHRPVRVNDTPLPAMPLDREQVAGRDRFPAIAVGWYQDGAQVHEGLVNAVAAADLDPRRRALSCWNDDGAGCEFRAVSGPEPGLEADIRGAAGGARFRTWGDLDSRHTSPTVAVDINSRLGNIHYVAWRRMHFAGEFDLPGGTRSLRGLGYFQRVCMNIPLFPWKWIWALLPDGALFSAFVPYLGANLLRRDYRFFRRDAWEQASLPLQQSAFLLPPAGGAEVGFERVSVAPLVAQGGYPHFLVTARSAQGDHLSFRAAAYGHAGFGVHRPVAGPLQTHWHYNEYMFRMRDFSGVVAGRTIDPAYGNAGCGNLEYTWGLGL